MYHNKVFKNTVFLYLRMAITMFISLYTSRLLLKYLGVTDFGIYNIVGGIVAAFSFLQGILNTATIRFLNISIVDDIYGSLKNLFGNILSLHVLLAILVVFLGETAGLFYIRNYLVVPSSKFEAANFVYQISLFTTLFTILIIPFNALLIVHEKMSIVAYLGIIRSIINLFAVLSLPYIGHENLITYSILILLLNVLIFIFHFIYCVKFFPESRTVLLFNRKSLKDIGSYMLWDLYGNFSVMTKNQGLSMTLNLFFGVVVNAAAGIASQVQIAISSFSSNFILAINPQLMQSYAKRDMQKVNELINLGSKLSFYLMLILCIPIIVNAQEILQIWLVNVPEFTLDFVKITLWTTLLCSFFTIYSILIHATGKLKKISFVSGTGYILILPTTYIFFKLGFPPNWAYIFTLIFSFLICLYNVSIAKNYVPELDIRYFFRNTFFRGLLLIVIIYSIILTLTYFFKVEMPFLKISLHFLICIVVIFLLGIDKPTKKILLNFVMLKIGLKHLKK